MLVLTHAPLSQYQQLWSSDKHKQNVWQLHQMYLLSSWSLSDPKIVMSHRKWELLMLVFILLQSRSGLATTMIPNAFHTKKVLICLLIDFTFYPVQYLFCQVSLFLSSSLFLSHSLSLSYTCITKLHIMLCCILFFNHPNS